MTFTTQSSIVKLTAEVPEDESDSGYRRTDDEIPRRFDVTPGKQMLRQERDNASSGEENMEDPTEEEPEAGRKK